MFYFSAGVALGAVATRRTRRAKEAARAAMAAKLTPSAIAADVADAIAELGNAVGSFAADLRQGAANRRAAYRPMVDGGTGAVAMLAPDQLGAGPYTVPAAPALSASAVVPPADPQATPGAGPAADHPAAGRHRDAADAGPSAERGRRSA
jgi:hypothetical protein